LPQRPSPGTLPRVDSAERVTTKPSSTFSSVTSASVSTDPSLWPASASLNDSAMVKQLACAAAISSSGLVPAPSSNRVWKP
jgi:hypothetical protein